jgi:DNA-binding CsgD family transcriptional regulator
MTASTSPSLSDRALRRALRFLRDRRREAPSLEQFAQAANAGLAELVGADIVTLSHCDLRAGTRSVVTWPDGALGADDVACFNRHFRAHPLVRFHSTHPRAGAHRVSDSQPLSSFRRSALYAEYYRRLGIDHVVAVPVRVDSDRLVSFVLNRADKDFSDRDCALLDALRFQLGAEYLAQETRLRARQTQAQLNELLIGAGMAVIVLDRQRRIRRCSVQACRWLAYAPLAGPVRCGERLPEAIDRWLRMRLEPSWAPCDPGPLSLPAPVHTLRLHLLVGEDALTLLIEAVADPAATALAHTTDLTARERDVLRWVAAGKSNVQIAQILAIRPRTVHKHLERVFRKLGVENRTAAALRARELMGIAQAERG